MKTKKELNKELRKNFDGCPASVREILEDKLVIIIRGDLTLGNLNKLSKLLGTKNINIHTEKMGMGFNECYAADETVIELHCSGVK